MLRYDVLVYYFVLICISTVAASVGFDLSLLKIKYILSLPSSETLLTEDIYIFFFIYSLFVAGQLLQAHSSSKVCHTYCEEEEGLDGMCPDW